jgi:hypothetical protein
MSVKRNHALIWLGVTFVLIVVLAGAPLIVAGIAGGIADALGCTLNEGGASGCVFMGRDIGETLAEMFVFGWLAFVTLPPGELALAIWLLVAGVVTFRWWRRRRGEA